MAFFRSLGYLGGLVAIGVVSFLVYQAALPDFALAKTVEELRQELESKRSALKSTEEKIKQFQARIQAKRQEARTLNDQIEIIADSVEAIELTVTQTREQIEEVDLEVQAVQAEIDERETEIERQKSLLAEYIRSIHSFDEQSAVTIFLKYQTFSEAINEAATISELQNRSQATLVTIQQLHSELITKKRELNDFKQSLTALRLRQESQQSVLSNQKQSKQRILDLTNAQEAEYRSLLQEAQQAHKASETAISRLDQALREELKKQGIGSLPLVGRLDWPVTAIFGISCPFHCSGYPYAYLIGPHAGIDVPTYVGTPIKAPADGYVARLHDSGGRGYSYILMLHGENISTVYGHVSGFAKVQEGQLVTRGTVIGYTGGAPGSRGSGLSSGPHLHFEVRMNNVPIDPMKYLGAP